MFCEYCKKQFTNKSNLKAHQKTTKYCIKIQNELLNQKIETDNFDCEFCLKKFTTKTNLKTHEKICIKKQDVHLLLDKDKTIEKLKILLEEKDKLIEKLMTMIQPVNISNNNSVNYSTSNTQKINNTINNLTPITDEHMLEQSKYFNIDYVKKGAIGYVDYALEYPFKNKILCVDFARRKIKYKNNDGDIVDDPEMVKLSQKFFKTIENVNSDIIGSYIRELGNNLEELNENSNNDMDEDETKIFGINSDGILDKTFTAIKYKKEVKEAADGNKPELYYDFVKNICSRVVCK
jgi:hypothetical protein